MDKTIYFSEVSTGNLYWIGGIVLVYKNTAVSPEIWSFWRFDVEDDEEDLKTIDNAQAGPTYGNISFSGETEQILGDLGLDGKEGQVLSEKEAKILFETINTLIQSAYDGYNVDWEDLGLEPAEVDPGYFRPWTKATFEMPTFGLFELASVTAELRWY